MNDLFANPAFQSGIAPFVTTLVAGLLLKRAGGYWVGLAVVLGFYVAVWLMIDVKFSPLTSTRKIILLGMAALIAGALLDLYPSARRFLPALLFVAGAAAITWVIWPVLSRREGTVFLLLAAGGVLYGGWFAAATELLRPRALPASVMVTMLGFGTGIAVLFGASALLGQLALAIGSAGGAYLLLSLFGRQPVTGSIMLLPAILLCGMIGYAGMVYAKLPWFALPFLALVPLAAHITAPTSRSRWMQAILLVLVVAPPAIIAAVIAWWVEGAPDL